MELIFPSRWVFGSQFEQCLDRLNPHQSVDPYIEIRIPEDCNVSIHAALLLISLINQLSHCGRIITLCFESTEKAYSYLSRMGFFECLAKEIEVRPERPSISGAMLHGGGNPQLVEIHEVPPGDQDSIQDLPLLLVQSLKQSLRNQPDIETLENHLATVLGEVLDNVYQHSGTSLAGLIALQPYRNASQPRIMLAISDSGYGITDTLRKAEPQALQHMTDAQIIVKVFQEGLSRFGATSGRGGGLRRCASIALRYGADLHVRLPTAIIHLVPGRNNSQHSVAYCRDFAPLLWGTHLCFEFQLTK